MTKNVSLASVVIMALLVAQHAVASEVAITGHEGVELCPDSLCGSAIFVGRFTGRVDKRRASGGFFVSIKHDPLPNPGESARITGGEIGRAAT